MKTPDMRSILFDMALDFMTANGNIPQNMERYARKIHNQVAIIEYVEGRALQASDWIDMAKKLGEQALLEDIGPRQIAKSIYPLLDGSRQFLARYASVPAGLATHYLLGKTRAGSRLSPELKKLLIQVIKELQTMSRQSPVTPS